MSTKHISIKDLKAEAVDLKALIADLPDDAWHTSLGAVQEWYKSTATQSAKEYEAWSTLKWDSTPSYSYMVPVLVPPLTWAAEADGPEVTLTPEDIPAGAWLEAADILDAAHDRALTDGVQCHGTMTDDQGARLERYDPHAVPLCIWDAISLAMAEHPNRQQHWPSGRNYGLAHLLAQAPHLELDEVDPVLRGIGIALAGKSPAWNDGEATVDDVYDALREGAKWCRERAGI